MTPALTLSWPSGIIHPKAILFCQKVDKDLDFDGGLEEMEDYRYDYDPKPPSRRPLVLIFLLLIVASVGYFVMNPDKFSLLTKLTTNMIMAPGSKKPAPPVSHKQIPIPMPEFQEKQLVVVFVEPLEPLSLKLSGDAEGKKPGPLVRAGEILTILDGAFVNNTWEYLVHTKSGALGWISEHQLKAQS